MIRKQRIKILIVLAFVVALCISFQLGLKWSIRSSFSYIAHEELDVAKHMQWIQLQEPKINQLNSTTESSLSFTTTSTPQIKHKTFLMTRRSCTQHYDLLLIISCAPGNFERRNNIRKTWAFERSAKPRWTSAFLVAQTRNEGVSNLLLEEDEALKDLVRAIHYDYYYNQTHKIKIGFEWAIRYCNFSFLLKLDDDVFVHVPRILSFLSAPTTPKKKLYAGNHYRNNHVARVGKWKVSYEEYNETTYRDFCPGFGCILSHDVVTAFVDTFSSFPYFRLDDVYVGMLASKNGFNITHNRGFEVWHPPQYVCIPTNDTLVRHDVGEECQMKIFNLAIFLEYLNGLTFTA